MSRNRVNGQHPDDEVEVRIPHEEFRGYRELMEGMLGGFGPRALGIACAAGGVTATTFAWAAIRPTRHPPVVAAGAATSAGLSVAYWLWAQRMRAALERMRSRETGRSVN